MEKGNTTSTQFSVNLPDFKGENYERWLAQMKVLFRFQIVVEIVNDRVPTLETDANDVRNDAHMEQRKKYGNGMSLLIQTCSRRSFKKNMLKKRWKS